MPLLDKYPACLREDLEAVASGDADAVFDISSTRNQLLRDERELQDELTRVRKEYCMSIVLCCTLQW